MRFTLDESQCRNLDVSAQREWLLTNGIGGYAMGTASGILTRRYHGHLIAATTPPTGRSLLLATLDATIQDSGPAVGISTNQYPGAIHPEGYLYLRRFEAAHEYVRWTYRAASGEITKELRVHPGANAVTVRYRNVGRTALTLTVRPLVCHRDHHGEFHEQAGYPQALLFPADGEVIEQDGLGLYLVHPGAKRTPVQGWYYRIEHQREIERGLPPRDDLFCPVELSWDLRPGDEAVLVASDDLGIEPLPAAPDEEEARGLGAMLRESAERFLIQTPNRRTVMAGWPWFTDWGRDTMISLPGLCLHTGCIELARAILDDHANLLDGGLIPNRIPEHGETPEDNTVDATLWFVNAIGRTLQAEWDEAFAGRMLAAVEKVFDAHVAGTKHGIRVDPEDGLLTQGEAGLQLTWMDAKVGDWVVTPRHGKPVEINGLWANACHTMAWLANCLGSSREAAFKAAGEKAAASFEAKFWHEGRGFYLDTVDPIDASLRPNQVIAMALPHSPCDPDHARRALGVVGTELATPYGLRTLGPNEPGYQGRYEGDMSRRDAAYHQGTAWPWLLGPYAAAVAKFGEGPGEARRLLREARTMLGEDGLGGIAEVYDGDSPQRPGGCPWQAWSVGEILRAWIEDARGE